MNKHTPQHRDLGFTVIELMVVVSILALLVAISLSAFSAAVAQSKISRTKVIIAKLDQLVMERYESYRTRALPIRTAPFVDLNGNGVRDPSEPEMRTGDVARMRMNAIRDLMRMELPDRISDVNDNPCDYDPRTGAAFDQHLRVPSLMRGYRRRAATSWNETSQGAECLYLIIASMRDSDKSALDFFDSSEIGDIDGDGMPEILDAWGRPIEFLRWAPGFTMERGALTMQTSDAVAAHDAFDPFRLDPNAFYLRPLIFSSGPDKEFDIFTDNVPTSPEPADPLLAPAPAHHYCPGTQNNAPNPYAQFAGAAMGTPANTYGLPGFPFDRNGDGRLAYSDNITNHYQEAE